MGAELDDVNLVMMSIAEPRPFEDSLVASIISVFKHQFVHEIGTESKNAEYLLQK